MLNLHSKGLNCCLAHTQVLCINVIMARYYNITQSHHIISYARSPLKSSILIFLPKLFAMLLVWVIPCLIYFKYPWTYFQQTGWSLKIKYTFVATGFYWVKFNQGYILMTFFNNMFKYIWNNIHFFKYKCSSVLVLTFKLHLPWMTNSNTYLNVLLIFNYFFN